MPKPSHREPLVDAGLRVMLRKGYVGSGVREIVAEAGAPQGSFTNHFASKEQFAEVVLDQYFEHVLRLVREALDDTTASPRDRLRRYLDLISTRLEEDDYARGCLIGDFSLETPGHSEVLRRRLAAVFAAWREPFAACIAAGQAAGQLDDTFAPVDLAEYLLASWEGAILRAKVERSAAPLERFKTIAFHTVFREEA